MRLFLTIEGQNCTENGLVEILEETKKKLSFVTEKEMDAQPQNNDYGTEFRLICVIPTCVDDTFWDALGWKERKLISRKKGEADIRLRINYEHFMKSTAREQRLLFYGIIIKSIQVVQERAVGDFRGNELIADILSALDVSEEELKSLEAL